jgi:hypothetical protein
MSPLPTDPASRKQVPLAKGLFDYFPDALIAVAAVSVAGNAQHHPDKPLHWDRSKSQDHDDALLRHFVDRNAIDSDGLRHAAKMAWRALAFLQVQLETARRAHLPEAGQIVPHAIAAAAIRDSADLPGD